MKLVATASLVLSGAALSANLPEWLDKKPPSGLLELSNARFADGRYRGDSDIYEEKKIRRGRSKKELLKAENLPGPPSKAIDGVIGLDDQVNIKEFTHSFTKPSPEFLVDLPEGSRVEEVIFYPRKSIIWEDHWARYEGLTVSVGGIACVPQQSLGKDSVKQSVLEGLKFKCDDLAGKSISVKNDNWIHLTEIEAKGYYIPDYFELDLSNARFADGLYWTNEKYHKTLYGQKWELPASKAIDGVIPEQCDSTIPDGFACSSSSENPQFIVDYQENTKVYRVVVYPRFSSANFDAEWNLNGAYQNWVVKVGGQQCVALQPLDAATVQASYFSGLKWDCNGAIGESITIDNNDFIYLAEIKAWGTKLNPCYNNDCQNGSTCNPNFADNTYTCKCKINNVNRYYDENFNQWFHYTIGEFCEIISIVTPDKTTYKAIQPFGVDTTKGTNQLEFEFKLKADSDSKLAFCGSGILDKRVVSANIKQECIELVLGTSGNKQSIFRSAVDSNDSPLADFVTEEAGVLNKDEFITFGITFFKDGIVRVYKEGELYLSNEASGIAWNENFDLIKQVGVSTATEAVKRTRTGHLLVRNKGEYKGEWHVDVRTVSFNTEGVVAGTP